mgnify:CR=1 FL=1
MCQLMKIDEKTPFPCLIKSNPQLKTNEAVRDQEMLKKERHESNTIDFMIHYIVRVIYITIYLY